MTATAIFFGAAAFCLGLIVGSFLNVCIYRLPREESIVYPPSHCPRCYQPIRAEDNIPVLSWFLLRGRCRFCGGRISFVYPAVEFFTGVLFVLFYWRFVTRDVPPTILPPAPRFVAYMGALYFVHMAFICALFVATVVDFKCLIIPDEISIGGTILGVAASFVFPQIHRSALFPAHPHLSSLGASLAGAAVGAFLIWAIGAAGKVIFRKEAMGLGDVKLMAMIGAFLGWQLVIFVLLFSAFLGAIYGAVHLAVTGRSKIPYGPFLSTAAVVSVIFRWEVAGFLGRMIQTYRFFLL